MTFLLAPYRLGSGYGETTRQILERWLAQGHDFVFVPVMQGPFEAARIPRGDERVLGMYPMPQFLPLARFMPATHYFTTWEVTPMPPHIARCVSETDSKLGVPCTMNAAGVPSGMQTRVIPQGHDPTVFYPSNAPRTDAPAPFTFLSVGEWQERKGFDLLLAAWKLANFAAGEARLVIKSQEQGGNSWRTMSDQARKWGADPNVRFEFDILGTDRLAKLYRNADCYVSATRGEGYCLPAHEAMACGKPAIMPDFGGHVDYIKSGTGVLVPTKSVSAAHAVEGFRGAEWCEVDVQALADAMRAMASSPSTARIMGEAAAKAVQDLTIDRFADTLWEWLHAPGT